MVTVSGKGRGGVEYEPELQMSEKGVHTLL